MRYYFPNTSSENFSILPVRAEKKNQKDIGEEKKAGLNTQIRMEEDCFLTFFSGKIIFFNLRPHWIFKKF